MSQPTNSQQGVKNNKPQIGPASGKDSIANKKDLNSTQNVMHHVGMIVNGFEIQKLIGKYPGAHATLFEVFYI